MKDIRKDAKDLREIFYTESELNEEYELVCNLTKLRKEKGLSQKKLAELADIDQPSIARIESGKHMPSLKMLVKLLNVMGYKIKFVKEK